MEKLFSIIVCSYNGERCLKKTLSTLMELKDYDRLVKQLILVNNNSTDKTEAIMNECAAVVNNTIVVSEKKPGLSNARLCGFNQVKSEWVVFVDDDNYLDSDWLLRAEEYLVMRRAEKLGVFGGAVIPYMSFDLTEKQQYILNTIYKSLAITHLDRNEICTIEEKHPCGKPFGAGMIVRYDILKQLKEEGWLKLEGRNGTKLTAGEDSEICYFAQKIGFGLGYCSKMILEHDIPRQRLELDYAIKLTQGIMEGVYVLSERDNKWILRRGKYILRILRYWTKNIKRKNLSLQEEIERCIEAGCIEVLIENLKKDKIFFKE